MKLQMGYVSLWSSVLLSKEEHLVSRIPVAPTMTPKRGSPQLSINDKPSPPPLTSPGLSLSESLLQRRFRGTHIDLWLAQTCLAYVVRGCGRSPSCIIDWSSVQNPPKKLLSKDITTLGYYYVDLYDKEEKQINLINSNIYFLAHIIL